MKERLREIVQDNPVLGHRLAKLRDFGHRVRNSEYHITNACNIRCNGCWFFEYDFDHRTEDLKSIRGWRDFVARECGRGITSAILIGGEPTLYEDRIATFAEAMPYVSVSTNGLKKLPVNGFENVAVGITLFGGGSLDDAIRGHKPSGKAFDGLLDTVLENYENDDRVVFIYALTDDAAPVIEPTVRRIHENGNQVNFSYYSSYGSSDPLAGSRRGGEVLDEALRVKEEYPETVVCDPYYIRTILTGATHWGGEFGYDVCPSISVDHPDHKERMLNGNRTLPLFNSYAADTKTLNFCCTSGHCESCRDSQAVYSWLLVNMDKFLDSEESLASWTRVCEGYWRQWVWSSYHPRAARREMESPRVSAPAP